MFWETKRALDSFRLLGAFMDAGLELRFGYMFRVFTGGGLLLLHHAVASMIVSPLATFFLHDALGNMPLRDTR